MVGDGYIFSDSTLAENKDYRARRRTIKQTIENRCQGEWVSATLERFPDVNKPRESGERDTEGLGDQGELRLREKEFVMKDGKEGRLVEIRKVLMKNIDNYKQTEKGGTKINKEMLRKGQRSKHERYGIEECRKKN